MPISRLDKKITEDTIEKDAYEVTFTNGAKKQLEELKEFYKSSDLIDVIKLGISLLQRIKEDKAVLTFMQL